MTKYGPHEATVTRDLAYYNNAISQHLPSFEVNELMKNNKI